MSSLITPNGSDVLGGRGNGSNMHPGNIKFRALVANHRETYIVASYSEKKFIIAQVVEKIRKGNGRFLKKKNDDWYIMDEKDATKKTSQALRERPKNQDPSDVNTMSTQPINVLGLGVNPHTSGWPADAPNNDHVDTQYNPKFDNSLYLEDIKTENDVPDCSNMSAYNNLIESCQNVDIGLGEGKSYTDIDSMNNLNMSTDMSPRNTKASPDVSCQSPNRVSNFCNQPDNKVSPKKTFHFGYQPNNGQIIPPFYFDNEADGANSHKIDGMNQNVPTAQNDKSAVPWITSPTSSLSLDHHNVRPEVSIDGPDRLFVARNETVSPNYHSEGKRNDVYDSSSVDLNDMSLTSLCSKNSNLSASLPPISNTDVDLFQTSMSRSMNNMASAVSCMSLMSLFNRSSNAEDRLEEVKVHLMDESDEERSMDFKRSDIFDNLTGSSESGQAYPRGKGCANMRDMMARLKNNFITLSGKSAAAFEEV